MNLISVLKDSLEVLRLLNDTPPVIAFALGIVFGGVLVMVFRKFWKQTGDRKEPQEEIFASKPAVVVDRNPAFFYRGYYYLFMAVRSFMKLAGRADRNGMAFLLYRPPEEGAPFVIVPERGAPEEYKQHEIALIVRIIEDYYKFALGPKGFEIAYDYSYQKAVELFFENVRWMNS